VTKATERAGWQPHRSRSAQHGHTCVRAWLDCTQPQARLTWAQVATFGHDPTGPLDLYAQLHSRAYGFIAALIGDPRSAAIHSSFFDESTVAKILAADGHADAILSSNSFAHIDDMVRPIDGTCACACAARASCASRSLAFISAATYARIRRAGRSIGGVWALGGLTDTACFSIAAMPPPGMAGPCSKVGARAVRVQCRVVAAVKTLLKPSGFLAFEVHHLLSVQPPRSPRPRPTRCGLCGAVKIRLGGAVGRCS
jgi:hypothetical protein